MKPTTEIAETIKYKEYFISRNKLIYFLYGIVCIISFFLPFFSNIQGNGTSGLRIVSNFSYLLDTFSSAATEQEIIAQTLAVLFLLLPPFFLIIGIYYVFKSATISVSFEKHNHSIHSTIGNFTFYYFLLWLIGYYILSELFEDTAKKSYFSLHIGCYIMLIASIGRFFLEAPYEEHIFNPIELESESIDEDYNYQDGDHEVGVPKYSSGRDLERAAQEANKGQTIEGVSYWVMEDSHAVGPITLDNLINRKLTEQDYIWYNGLETWKRVGESEIKDTLIAKEIIPPPFKPTPPPFKQTPPAFKLTPPKLNH